MIYDCASDINSISHPIIKLKTIDWIDSNGFVTKKKVTDVVFSGSLQPITTEEMARYPQGYLKVGSIKLYTISSLDVDDQIRDPINRIWVVKGIDDWTLDGNYFKYLLERVPNA